MTSERKIERFNKTFQYLLNYCRRRIILDYLSVIDFHRLASKFAYRRARRRFSEYLRSLLHAFTDFSRHLSLSLHQYHGLFIYLCSPRADICLALRTYCILGSFHDCYTVKAFVLKWP